MKPGIAYWSLISALTVSSALADNVTVIEQVGPGSVEVKQDETTNSVEVKQPAETQQSIEKKRSIEKEKIKNPAAKDQPQDYRKSVLTDPFYTPRGRARAIIGGQTGETPSLLPDDRPSKANENEVYIYQKGKKNRIVSHQKGEDNSLSVEQYGESNELSRTQEGKHNRSHVVVNGKTIEDEETSE